MPENHDNPIELRVRRSYLATGIICAIGFAIIGTVSVVVAAWNIDGSFPNPTPMAVFFGVFWGAWFLLSLYSIAASYREKLTVTSDTVTQACVFLTRTIRVSDVTTAKWRARPVGGSIVIRSSRSRNKIDFNNFDENYYYLVSDSQTIGGGKQPFEASSNKLAIELLRSPH